MLDAPRIRIALFVAGGICAVATFLPLLPTNEWWVRIFDFPRVLIASLQALTALAFVLVYRRKRVLDSVFLVVSAVSLGYQLVRIAPYTPLWPTSVASAVACDDGDGFRLITANVLQTNRNAPAFLELVRAAAPDVLLVLETDAWWEHELAVLEGDYPFVLKKPLENTYGLLLYSKLPLSSASVRYLVEPDVPSIRATVTLPSGKTVLLYGLHPRPPNPGQDTDARDGELILVAKEVTKAPGSVVVAGDMNDVAWSDTTTLFEKIGGLLDPREGRGVYSTFHADHWFLRWPLDYVFVTPSFRLLDMQVLQSFGSDHLPVLVDLCHAPGANAPQEAPSAADSKDATEAVRDARDGDD